MTEMPQAMTGGLAHPARWSARRRPRWGRRQRRRRQGRTGRGPEAAPFARPDAARQGREEGRAQGRASSLSTRPRRDGRAPADEHVQRRGEPPARRAHRPLEEAARARAAARASWWRSTSRRASRASCPTGATRPRCSTSLQQRITTEDGAQVAARLPRRRARRAAATSRGPSCGAPSTRASPRRSRACSSAAGSTGRRSTASSLDLDNPEKREAHLREAMLVSPGDPEGDVRLVKLARAERKARRGAGVRAAPARPRAADADARAGARRRARRRRARRTRRCARTRRSSSSTRRARCRAACSATSSCGAGGTRRPTASTRR